MMVTMTMMLMIATIIKRAVATSIEKVVGFDHCLQYRHVKHDIHIRSSSKNIYHNAL